MVMELNDNFVTYEEAKKLKDLGFDEECFGRFVNGELLNYKDYNDDDYHWDNEIISAPLHQQATKWFEEH